MALKYGARSIEHGSFIDDEGVRLLLEKDAWLVPTLMVGEQIKAVATTDGALQKAAQLQQETDERSFACLRKAIAAGVRVALGTDYIGWDPRDNYREAHLLVHHLGMTTEHVLRAATSSAADLLRLPVGRLRPGCAADIIGLRASPLVDVNALKDVDFVMIDGVQVV
jgi:imidazolonepropionase-like amidohydrolase